MAASDVLVVMARKPVVGAVKTRLAAVLGAEVACDLYRAFLCDLRARLECDEWRLLWAVHPHADLSDDVGAAVHCIAQRGEDLGERMTRVFAELFAAAAARVVMIGADLPHLSPAVVRQAFRSLERADAVMVPTRDGGYGLVGLRQPVDLFTGIETGVASTRRDTLARAKALGLDVVLLDETFDLDEVEDLRELRALIASGEVDLPSTAEVLGRAGLR